MLGKVINSDHADQAATTYDSVTQLLDRPSLIRELNNILTANDSNQSCVFGIANVEQFKLVNHSYGNDAGDYVLQEIAKRMEIEFGDEAIIGRMGNDEFGFISMDKDAEQIRLVCETINDSFIRSTLPWKDKKIHVRVKFGIVLIDNNKQDTDQILKSANEAIYSAQYDGGSTICEYDQNDTAILRRSGNLQHAITVDHWIARNLFLLFLQPIVYIDNPKKVSHFEILIRGKSNEGKIITPGKLISAAEDFNLTTKLDKWVIRSLFSWINEHNSSVPSKFKFAVNISALSVNDNELCDYIIDLVEEQQINPKQISFEITERVAISNMKRCYDFMSRLKKLGFTFALDDFGTGYCSFKYIKTLPFDIIKIDGSFIKNIDTDQSNFGIVKAISDITKVFNKKTVAECIETETVSKILLDLGVDYGQGYLYSKPIPIESLTKLKN